MPRKKIKTVRDRTERKDAPPHPHANDKGKNGIEPAPPSNELPSRLSPEGVIDMILANGGRSSDDTGVSTLRRRQPAKPMNGHAKPPQLRFIDLFCGIGGFRLAFEHAGIKCVFSSDWDKFSRQTYAANFGEEPAGDINAIPVADIPPFDILCGGFPCQPFR